MEIHNRIFGTTPCQIRIQRFNPNKTLEAASSWLAEAWLERGPVRGPDKKPIRQESSTSEEDALQKMEECLAQKFGEQTK
jgi:hypothetical protein